MAEETVCTDLDLLTTAISGNPDSPTAVEHLRRRFAPMIHGLARRFSWDSDSFEELDQEGNLALIEALPLFDSTRKTGIGTFIHQRALSRMLHWRRSQRQTLTMLHPHSSGQLRSLDEEVEADDEGHLTLHDVVAADGDQRPRGVEAGLVMGIVRKALARLPKRQADVVRLRFWLELPPSQIAQRLGVSRPRATVLLQASMSNLRRDLSLRV